MDSESFYRELTRRNRVLISAEVQERLRRQRFVIAGVGSTGGACVMPLVRSGAVRLALADPGRYELGNLNRQEARLCDVGRSKARVQAERALAVNPFPGRRGRRGRDRPGAAGPPAPRGRPGDRRRGRHRALGPGRQAGAARGLLLAPPARHHGVRHRVDAVRRAVYDYTRVRRPLRGRVRSGDLDPLRVLRALVPLRALPHEIFAVLEDRRRAPDEGWPQLAMTSALLGPLVVAYVLRLLAGRPARDSVRIDLLDVVRPAPARLLHRRRRDVGLVRELWQLRHAG